MLDPDVLKAEVVAADLSVSREEQVKEGILWLELSLAKLLRCRQDLPHSSLERDLVDLEHIVTRFKTFQALKEKEECAG